MISLIKKEEAERKLIELKKKTKTQITSWTLFNKQVLSKEPNKLVWVNLLKVHDILTSQSQQKLKSFYLILPSMFIHLLVLSVSFTRPQAQQDRNHRCIILLL